MAFDWLKYLNQGAIRDQALNPKLVNALSFLPDMGVTMDVFSGGQDAAGPDRTGSHRHDHGNAADVFFLKDGRKLDWANPQDIPVFQQIVERAKANGVTGFGAGPGYMREGSMHIGFGTPAVWGAGGKGANAPDWLRQAFGAAPSASPAPVVAPVPSSPAGGARAASEIQPFGSMAPTPFPGGTAIANWFNGTQKDADAINAVQNGDKPSPLQRLAAALQKFPDAPQARSDMPGPAATNGDALLKYLQQPRALAEMLMRKRLQG